MSGDWRDLAARLNASIDQQSVERAAEEAAHQAALAEGRAARVALFTDLKAFGELIGPITVDTRTTESGEPELLYRNGEKWLKFSHSDEGERVRLSFEGSEQQDHVLYREQELGRRWVWSADTVLRQHRHVLFTAGLEAMMTSILGLPDPTETAAPPEERETSPGEDRKRTL